MKYIESIIGLPQLYKIEAETVFRKETTEKA
jgi:hypothetical protein